ncbi:lactate utilization protein [Sporosalibacterium faouarense]|uniref:lactate utilization protein n=1 Tax=Sporosalibacterium faouarense TaxID=516123 RepID=UPI00141C1DCC|nr:lactate utilization protein [Sporosalibacterium faouarense]MTI49161.1 lactate utilization protein [Bacillota bacterium]
MNMQIEKLITNFKDRNIRVLHFNKLEEAKEKILEIIPIDSTVGVGNSKTLKQMDISKILSNRGNIVFDKTNAKNKEEIKVLKKKSLITDWYLTSSNAISEDGQIVNIDHSGNRVAAMTYGPDKVIIVVGKNKIRKTLEEAIDRVRNHSVQLNAKRAGYNPPCLTTKKCVDCRSKDRVCYYLSIIEGQFEPERMLLFIIDEELGF